MRRTSAIGRWCGLIFLFVGAGCAQQNPPDAASPPEDRVVYDRTRPKTIAPRDRLERRANERGADLRLVDRLMDDRTRIPEFDRPPLPPPARTIAPGVTLLDDAEPFPAPEPTAPKEETIHVAIAQSTYRTRTDEEVLAAVQPFVDLVHREVNVRGAADLQPDAESVYFGLIDGETQMAIAHVFDYLMVRSWLANEENNATILLASATPANARSTTLDADLAGTEGTSIELVVALDSEITSFADLRGKKLAVAAAVEAGPGTFLTQLLLDADHPLDERYFESVALRQYPKDAVIDVIKGYADAACVDQGTVGALARFYGIDGTRVRTIAVSPRYNMDVLFTTINNLETHRTEIELTQTQLTTLGKDPEGEEVLFFFDTAGWFNYRDGDIAVPLEYFETYLKFVDETPADLTMLRDPDAPVNRRTYDRFGDE